MDDSVLDALDRLHRRASSSIHHHALFDAETSLHPNFDTAYSENKPFELDDFDQSLMRQPDPNSRQNQAALGRARLSLPLVQHRRFDDGLICSNQKKMISNQTHDHGHGPTEYNSTCRSDDSPSSGIALPSSPTYLASQRHMHYKSASFSEQPRAYTSSHASTNSRANPRQPVGHSARPGMQSIPLVSVQELPDRFRLLFPFVFFNAVQSKCFQSVYETSQNFVLSSPTGSGKTAVFELAICRLVNDRQNGSFKVVYMAPTKALCAQRTRDWKTRLGLLGLQCEELTGDSNATSLYNVQYADIIVTTPEKWDSMTRKWKDHEKLIRLVKLFLIDEVHILTKDRGAALEAVVSRMKSVGTDMRFVALSATLPNSHDIATWLGRDSSNQNVPAARERFGEEFRPVRLQKHVCGYQNNSNAFAFDTSLNKRLPDVITKYSQGKPLMVFCFTRKSCLDAAKFLAEWWRTSNPSRRCWPGPRRDIKVDDNDLRSMVASGVAVHHGGIGQDDRTAMERAYLAGDLQIICCTSTLSVGVNLPAHMVIIKGTVSYEGNVVKEYSDLDVMQMIGRAGRSQFDDSAIAVIMTRLSQINRYERMVSGQEQLESCLHLNLIEHLNAEIGLGTVTDLYSAKRWLQGTFLRVRLQENPRYYHIEGDTGGCSLDERLEKICTAAVSQLTEHGLVVEKSRLKLTEYGEAMTRYYVNLATMIAILNLPDKAKPSEILSALAQAHEFREIRIRAGEKQLYKEINKSPGIRFPIKVDIALPAHKVTLIIQSVLGGVDTAAHDAMHKIQHSIDQGLLFQHVHRLIRCIIDCQSYRKDAVGIRNALLLSRSLAARVWDDSPLVLRQIDQLGPVAVRKLVAANINSIDDLELVEPGRIERVLGKNPAFAHKILAAVKTFPKLRISIQLHSQPNIKHGEHVVVNLAVEVSFLNDKVPTIYLRKPVFVIILAETSDGQLLNFCRISAQKLAKANPILFAACLKRPKQSIYCYAMCDELAGTVQQVRLSPDIPVEAFRSIGNQSPKFADHSNAGSCRNSQALMIRAPPRRTSDNVSGDWGDGDIDDRELISASERNTSLLDVGVQEIGGPVRKKGPIPKKQIGEPRQLENGKWACNHACKNKAVCKHLCCREGTDKKPRPKVFKEISAESGKGNVRRPSRMQSKLELKPKQMDVPSKRKMDGPEHLDLSYDYPDRSVLPANAPPATMDLSRLQGSMGKIKRIPSIYGEAPENDDRDRGESFLNLMGTRNSSNGTLHDKTLDDASRGDTFDDTFDDFLMDDLPDPSILIPNKNSPKDDASCHQEPEDSMYMDDDQDMLDALLIGAEDSLAPQEVADYEERQSLAGDAHTGKVWHDPMSNISSESGLYVRQKACAAPTPPRASTIAGPVSPNPSKRKAHGDNCLSTDTKRLKTSSMANSDTRALQRAMHETTGACDSGESNKPENAPAPAVTGLTDIASGSVSRMSELRAWLTAEVGDSVELVETLE